jgi:heme exporter protein D
MNHFLHMGGYAAFVWPAYVATLLGLGAAIALTLQAYRRAKTQLAILDAKDAA